MAIRETRICDVFGTAKKVERWQFYLVRVDDEGNPIGLIHEGTEALSADLSPRAVERAKKFMERAMTAPTTQAKEGQDDADENT